MTPYQRLQRARRMMNMAWVRAYMEALTEHRPVRLLRPDMITMHHLYDGTYRKEQHEAQVQ